jgi:PPIC-type PPIASE domain
MSTYEDASSDTHINTRKDTVLLASTLDTRPSTLGRFLREPLLHFLLLGALIFAAFRFVSGDDANRPSKIVVTQGQIESLAITFGRTWRRPPTAAELEGLVRDYVREEIYAREAMTLGLDRDDTIIRRRLRQKLEFISEDVANQADPSEEQLRAYLTEHPDVFRTDRRFTFDQVYLNPQQRVRNLEHDAAQMLARLQRAGSKADVASLGDSLMLDYEFNAIPAIEVAKQFGEKFAAKLGQLPVGQWQGPIESGYGAHLVLLRQRTEGHVPALEEVRDAVRSAWANAHLVEASEQFYQNLLKRYHVIIEASQPADDAKKLAQVAR